MSFTYIRTTIVREFTVYNFMVLYDGRIIHKLIIVATTSHENKIIYLLIKRSIRDHEVYNFFVFIKRILDI